MSRKKKIIIPGWNLGESSFGVTKPYLEFFSQFGQVEILTPRKGIEECDLLVIPGGKDTNPFNYGEVPSFYTGDGDVHKEYFYKQNLPQYIEAGIPMFGICLGMQVLNSYFGGTLTQNLLYHPYYSSPRTERVHKVYSVVDYNRETRKFNYIKKEVDKFNSLHHQGIYADQLGEGLIPTLCSEGDYLIEAFIHETLPISACQAHPEEMYDDYSTNEINRLLNAERNK